MAPTFAPCKFNMRFMNEIAISIMFLFYFAFERIFDHKYPLIIRCVLLLQGCPTHRRTGSPDGTAISDNVDKERPTGFACGGCFVCVWLSKCFMQQCACNAFIAFLEKKTVVPYAIHMVNTVMILRCNAILMVT